MRTKKNINKVKENFPWLIFLTCVILFILSMLFKAYDMAAVGVMGMFGAFIVFFRFYYFDKKCDRELPHTKTENHLTKER